MAGYRGSHAYVFPAHMVRVWTAEGELIPDGKGNVLIKPRGSVVVREGEFLVGEHVYYFQKTFLNSCRRCSRDFLAHGDSRVQLFARRVIYHHL